MASTTIPIVALSIGLMFGSKAFSQTITLSPAGGPPTTSTQVSGSGFSPSASIDIYFGRTDEASATADGSGSFSNIAIQVPASALQGEHTVSAVPSGGGSGAQATFAVYTNWPQYGFGPNHTGHNPYENVLSPSTVGSIELKWTSSIQASPTAVADGVVYASAEHAIYALDASTGAPLWGHASGPVLTATPVVASGVVYVADDNGAIYAFDAGTGAELWTYVSNGAVDPGSFLTVVNEVLYFPNVYFIYGLNANSGALVSIYDIGGGANYTPAVANGVVYVGSVSGYVEALDVSTGAMLWVASTNPSCYCGFAPSAAVADGVVYESSEDGYLYAFDASTGARLWTFSNGREYKAGFGSIAVANGVVYAGSPDNYVYALNASTGVPVWAYNAGGMAPVLVVANGVVYAAVRDGNLYALNSLTGAELWSYAAGAFSPVVANGKLYAVCGGFVCAFGLPDGAGTENR
jgi:outer membrane protein assembly factor BamB